MNHIYYVPLVLLLTYISDAFCAHHAAIRPSHAQRPAARQTHLQPHLAKPLPRNSSWNSGPPINTRTTAYILAHRPVAAPAIITPTPPATPATLRMEALRISLSMSTPTSSGTPATSTPVATPPTAPTSPPMEALGTLPSAGTPTPLTSAVAPTTLSPSALARQIALAELPASSTSLPSPTVSNNDTSAMMISQMLNYAQQAAKTSGALKDPDETDWEQLETPTAKTSPTYKALADKAPVDQSLAQRFFGLFL